MLADRSSGKRKKSGCFWIEAIALIDVAEGICSVALPSEGYGVFVANNGKMGLSRRPDKLGITAFDSMQGFVKMESNLVNQHSAHRGVLLFA